jgi:hypothetical protein
MPLPTELVLPRDVSLATVGRRYYSWVNFMSNTIVSIGAMDALVHHYIAVMFVRVYGPLVTQWISSGQLCVMERVLAGEHFAWGLTLHDKMVGQLDHYRSMDTGDFSFGPILGAWFLERVPMLHPRILLGVPKVKEPVLKQWSTILLHHGGGKGYHFFTVELAQVWWQMS